jgi:spermidine synthase
MAAYWSARTRYIEIGRDVRLSPDVRLMLAQLREPLLSVLDTSPDFQPAYEPLLQMATVLGRIDAPSAKALLAELARLQPTRPEAGQVLGELEKPGN